jgi:AraC family transcriptional regulator of adaptative response/methylated-DNA-[protein]-cysteine methyltransferase
MAKQNRKDSTIHYATGLCVLGTVLAAQNERGICAILLADNAAELLQDLQQRFPAAELVDSNAALRPLLKQVADFIAAPDKKTDFSLDLQGTDFQKKVWQALRKIPVGNTVTYTNIAKSIGCPTAARAVASACAANPIAVLIPCHRVLRRNGSLSGYRWGIERKRELLLREAG